jgi:hypothetical protein
LLDPRGEDGHSAATFRQTMSQALDMSLDSADRW